MKAKPSAMFGDVVYVFESTGRSFTPNDGIWGLTSDFQPRGGYDDTYYVTSNDPDDYQPKYSTLTHAECVELGEYMAAQWRAFADKHRGAAVEQADDKRLTPTEAVRTGMVSVDDLAGIGERIAKAFPNAEQVFGRTVVCCGQCGSDKATKRAIDGMIVCDKCGAWTEEG